MMRGAWRWLPTYVSLAVMLGSTFGFVKLALAALTPVGAGLARVLLGGATLLVICAASRTRLPPRRLWGALALAALLSTTVPWVAAAWAQTSISSALAGIISSSVPLLTLLAILAFFREETPSRQRVIGIILGFAGMLVVVGVWHGAATGSWVGIGAMLLANTMFAISFPFTRRYLTGDGLSGQVEPLSLVAGMFIMAALEIAPLALFFDLTSAPVDLWVVVGVMGAGCLGSGLAYVLTYRLIRITDATSASTVMYFVPLVAILIGVTLFDEHVTWNQPVGGVVVLAGAAIAQGVLPRGRLGAAGSQPP